MRERKKGRIKMNGRIEELNRGRGKRKESIAH